LKLSQYILAMPLSYIYIYVYIFIHIYTSLYVKDGIWLCFPSLSIILNKIKKKENNLKLIEKNKRIGLY